MDQNYLIV